MSDATAALRDEFEKLIRKKFPPKKLMEKLEQLWDAKDLKQFSYQGSVIKGDALESWAIQKAALELAVHYGHYLAPERDPLAGGYIVQLPAGLQNPAEPVELPEAE